MAEKGNPNSVSDAGVGALCAKAAVHGAYLNVMINASGLEDKAFANAKTDLAKSMLEKAKSLELEILETVEKIIKS
jgi:glutamate formiminotransferase/formiminotetrahydrofolate cyclodeaminase